MEEHNPTLAKHAMTYGAILGLILIVYSVLLYISDLTFNRLLSTLQYVILFGGIYMGTKSYRDKALGGFITYGKALWLGLLISVFVGIITVFFSYIMMRYIDPGLIDKYMLIMEERFANSKFIPEGQIDAAMERSRKAMTALWSIPLGVFSFSLFGLVISLITSAFIKRNPNPLS